MKGDAAVQFEHENFRRLYRGIFFALDSQGHQASLSFGQEAGQKRDRQVILSLDTIAVSVFPGTKRIKVTGFYPREKGSFYLCKLDFRPF